MREVRFKEINETLALAMGLDAADNQLTPAISRKQAAAINAATRYAWEYYPWPEVTSIIRGMTHSDGFSGTTPTVIPGAEVLRVYKDEPVALFQGDDGEPETIPFQVGPDGAIYVQDDTTVSGYTLPYYVIRWAAPKFGSTAFVLATSYHEGDAVYDATSGDAFVAVHDTSGFALPSWTAWSVGLDIAENDYIRHHGTIYKANTAHTATAADEPGTGDDWLDSYTRQLYGWAPQRLPEFLLQAVLIGAEGWLTRTAGQSATAAMMASGMEDLLAARVRHTTLTQKQQTRSRATRAA